MSTFDDLSGHARDQIHSVMERVGDLLDNDRDRAELYTDMAVDLVAGAAIMRAAADGRDPTVFTDGEKLLAAHAIVGELFKAFELPDHQTPRKILPLRRTSGSIDFLWQNVKATFTVGFSLYSDWRCAEIFLNVSKSDGMAEANARDAGILASFALQHGATLDRLVAAVTHEPDGSASSIVGTALNLVAAEIETLRRGDPPENPGDGVAPLAPNAGPGDGGGATTAVPTAVQTKAEDA